MQKPGIWKIMLLLAAFTAALIIVYQFRSTPPAPVQTASVERKTVSSSPPLESKRHQDIAPAPAETTADDDERQIGLTPLPREKVEEYVAQHNRSAQSLLAAFHVLNLAGNPNGDQMLAAGSLDYLKEAATNFPNDPQVQWTIVARDAFPEERRKWLDAFKSSSPDNSLANYVSARDYFKSGQLDTAVSELLAASGKSQFKDYSTETQLDGEGIAAATGQTGQTAMLYGSSAMAADLLPELSNFKGLTRDMMALQKQYASVGDSDSALNLVQMGVTLSDRFNRGDGSKFVINQLVGIAMESIVLQSLDQNTSYDFLGGKTPVQEQADLKQRRMEFRDLQKAFNDAMPQMTEADWVSYSQRQKVYGEVEAWRWLQQQHGTKPNTGN